MADDRSPKKKSLEAMVKAANTLPMVPARTSPVRVQLSRISEGGKAIANAIPQPVKTISRHSVWAGSRVMMAAIIAALLFIGGGYARLLRGPISLSFLVPKIQDQLNGQVQGYRFHIGDAILRLSRGWGLEFRLADVSLIDDSGEELAKAPFAALDVSEPSLLRFAFAPSEINLLGPKLLVFNLPGKGLTFTASPESGISQRNAEGPYALGNGSGAAPAYVSPPIVQPKPFSGLGNGGTGVAAANTPKSVNLAPLLKRLFTALEKRPGASSALQRVGLKEATIYFVQDSGVVTWRVPDLHIDLEERGGLSTLKGELELEQSGVPCHISFQAVNRPGNRVYSLAAKIEDVVPRSLGQSLPSVPALKLINVPVTAGARLDLDYDGAVVRGDADINLGNGEFFLPGDEKHPANINDGTFHLQYDRERDAIAISPFELRWQGSVLNLKGSVQRHAGATQSQDEFSVNLDGSNSKLSSVEFGVPATGFDIFRLAANYSLASDSLALTEFRVKSGEAEIALSGSASNIGSKPAAKIHGVVSPMPVSFLKVLWPTFVAHGARDWIGTNIAAGRITGGEFNANLTSDIIANLDRDGDVPDSAASLRLGLAGLQIYQIKGLPPIEAKAATARLAGRRFVLDIPSDAQMAMPSGRTVAFADGQFIIDDLRPRIPNGEVRFKGAGEAAAVMELLDQPPLGYVKAVGFKPDLINGQVSTSFDIKFPLLRDLKFKQMDLSGKARVSDLKSKGLPSGLVVNGGAVNFDISQTAIGANGDLKLNGVPISLTWQRIFDAPPEKQPTLRVAGIFSEKAREDLGFNINHILRGDLPIALALSLQKDTAPAIAVEANLTNNDIFLTAIGWRKPPGQKATITFDLNQRQDNFLVLDNLALTGDGLGINGHILLNEKRRIAGFSFPEFSTNALTRLQINGELTPQNILKIQAKGPSYDGRQFFRSLFSAGKLAENQPNPKDEPGLDLNVEIETVFGFYDTTVKSVVVDAKRRNGKLTYMDVAGRLNGEAPLVAHVEQKQTDQRMLIADATDAGSAFRMVGFYADARGGQMQLRVNLDAGATEKTGVLDARNFQVTGDQVVGKVMSKADQESARRKPGAPGSGFSGDTLQFDRLYVPFTVGSGQFVLHDAVINGPVLGATLRGRIDYGRDTINLSGTYVPFYGLNAVLGGLPILGDILNGRQGEGMLGITFAVQGKTSNPDVLVNPVSMLAPGFLRQAFEFENQSQQQAPTPPQKPGATPKTRAPSATQ